MPASAVVAISFFAVICLGTALLCLPFATRDYSVNFLNSLFTATSASCVTGLIVVDTFSHWSYFGQAVILLLIQIGGLGFITIISLFMLYVKKHASLSQRKLVMQSAGSVDLASIKGLVKYILLGTLIFEFCGAFLLSISFVRAYGWGLGIWQAIFTSVSAFCNAGFTVTGMADGKSSLMAFVGDPLVNIVVILLIVIGGIGFFVWGDVVHNGVHVKKFSFHSKVVLTTTGVLIIIPWALFMAFEWNNPATIGGESAGVKILASLFMAVTPRTAGFNSVDYAGISAAGGALTDVLMFIGGSPGSTAGGIKTTTIAVFVLTALATSRRRDETHIFKRRFESDAGPQAGVIVCLYLVMIVLCVLCVAGAEGNKCTLDAVVFEVISAIGTVGLSHGITPTLGVFSKLVLIFLMFFGRVGGYTLILIFSSEKKPVALSRVAERIIIG